MSFLQPLFLWALGLLAVPLVIHLFNFRRYQKVIFSNVDMLKEIQTESRKTRQIKKWLILATRMLALAALIFAFAQPFLLEEGTKDGRKLISLYLDNSESMRAEGQDGQLFEYGKNAARQVLQNLPKDAEVQ
ncbi:MAG: BatA and WFA domain-containing protein, partial [Bacteroidia bacterium]